MRLLISGFACGVYRRRHAQDGADPTAEDFGLKRSATRLAMPQLPQVSRPHHLRMLGPARAAT